MKVGIIFLKICSIQEASFEELTTFDIDEKTSRSFNQRR